MEWEVSAQINKPLMQQTIISHINQPKLKSLSYELKKKIFKAEVLTSSAIIAIRAEFLVGIWGLFAIATPTQGQH